MEAMALRLESLKLLATQKQLGLEHSPTKEQMLPIRYQHLTIEALERGLIARACYLVSSSSYTAYLLSASDPLFSLR
jgi:hypothetical protein